MIFDETIYDEDVIRAVIYLRVSTDDQARYGYSLPAQLSRAEEYCKSKGYTVVARYTDAGISGKTRINRDAFQRMVADAERKQFERIVVWKITRFARNLVDFVQVCSQLEENGIYIESVSEPFDSTTSIGRMIRGLLATVAEWEREVISENVSLAIVERAEQGKRTCHDVLGYDTDGPDRLKINPEGAEIVRGIFYKYLETESLTEVSEWCKAQGYIGKRGGEMTPWSVCKILTRPVYCGYYTLNGEIYPSDTEKIIDIEVYNKVQLLLDSNPNAKGKRKKPLRLL